MKDYEKAFKISKASPRFKEGDRVVLISRYPDGSSPEAFDYDLQDGTEYFVAAVNRLDRNSWRQSGIEVLLEGTDWFVDQAMLAAADK